MSGQAIYENFANSDLRVLSYGAHGATQISTNYQERADTLKRLAINMNHAWQGEAGSAARRGAGPLAVEHEVAAPQIGNAARSMQRQAVSFDRASNSVVPVPDMPEKPGFWDNFFSIGGASANYERQVTAIQAATEHNIAVMRAYEDATRQNQAMLTGIPTVLNPTNPGDGGQQPSGPGAPAPRPMSWRIPPSGGGGQAGGGQTGTSSPQTGAQWSGPQTSPTGHTGLGETHPDFARPVPPTSGLAGAGLPKPTPQGQLPGGPGPGYPPLGGPGSLGGGSGSGADGRRAGGPGGARGFGPGGPGGSGGPGEDGARRGGIGPRSAAGLEAGAGRGTAGAAGRGGVGSSPMGGGTRQQGDEDGEHRRPSFLVEPDPDDTFGTDAVTAPPVIGG